MKIYITILLSIVIFSISLSQEEKEVVELVLGGSTTVQKSLLEPTQDLFFKKTGIKIKVLGIGSGGGFKRILEGKSNVSIASSPMSSLLKKNKIDNKDGLYLEHVIVNDIIVPIVNKKNTVKKLTWAQLKDIHTGKIKNWSEVGGNDQKIIVITSHKGSATRDVFQKKVMNKEEYIKKVREVKTTRQEIDLVNKFKGGIGAVSESFVKMNPIVNIVESDEISRPLLFITKGKPEKNVQILIDFLNTEEAKKLFK